MTNNTQTHISNGGRVVIPAEYRKILGIDEGDIVNISLDEYGIRISTPRLALRKLQMLAKKRVPKGRLVSDELTADRRKEAKHEHAQIKGRNGKK